MKAFFMSFLWVLFRSSSGVLRKKYCFPEAFPKKTQRIPKENSFKPVNFVEYRSEPFTFVASACRGYFLCYLRFRNNPKNKIMAIFNKGVLGGFSGKVGTVVGTTYRGQDVLRSLPRKSGKAPFEKQLQQQMIFKLVTAFLQPLKNIQSQFFGSKQGTKSRNNLAQSYTMKECIAVTAGVPSLVYNKVLITKGELAGFKNVISAAEPNQVIDISWDDNSAQGNANASDKVSVVCWCEEVSAFEIYENVALRSDATASVTLSAYYAGKDVQVWSYFSNDAGTQACNSAYLGTLTLL